MRRLFSFIPAIFILLLAIFLGVGQIFHISPPKLRSSMQGGLVKDFFLNNMQDRIFIPEKNKIKAFSKKKPVLVVFFASWCQSCKIEIPYLRSLKVKYPEIPIIAIVHQELSAGERLWVANYGAEDVFDGVIVDAKGRYTIDFGVQEFPEFFLLTQQGKVLYHVRGSIAERKHYENLKKYLHYGCFDNVWPYSTSGVFSS